MRAVSWLICSTSGGKGSGECLYQGAFDIGFCFTAMAEWRGTQAFEQGGRAAPAAVAMLSEKDGEAPLTASGGAGGRWVALHEGQGDGRVDLGKDGRRAGPERVEQAAQWIGQLHPGGDQVIASTHQRAKRTDGIRLRLQGVKAGAIGAQQIGEQVGIGGIALGAVTAIARTSGLDDVGVNRHHRVAGFDQGYRRQGPRDARWRWAVVPGDGAQRCNRASNSRNPAASWVTSNRSSTVPALSMMHTRVIARRPIQSCEPASHGQPPASWSKTCSAASPRGSLIDRRSGSHTLALHPVARLGLAAPRALREVAQ